METNAEHHPHRRPWSRWRSWPSRRAGGWPTIPTSRRWLRRKAARPSAGGDACACSTLSAASSPPGPELQAQGTWPVPAEVEGRAHRRRRGRRRCARDLRPVAAGGDARRPRGRAAHRRYATAGLGELPRGRVGFGTWRASASTRRRSCRWRYRRPTSGGRRRYGGNPAVLCPRRFQHERPAGHQPDGGWCAPTSCGAARRRGFANAGAWRTSSRGWTPIRSCSGKEHAVPADARTDTETVSIVADAAPAQAPAGRNLTASVAWAYQRSGHRRRAGRGGDQQPDQQQSAARAEGVDRRGVLRRDQDRAAHRRDRRGGPIRDGGAGELLGRGPHLPEGRGDRVVRRLATSRGGAGAAAAGRGFIFSGAVGTLELGKGTFAVSVFVQDVAKRHHRVRELAAGTNGVAALVADCNVQRDLSEHHG